MEKHTSEAISQALGDHRRGISFRSYLDQYGTPIAMLCRRAKTKGGQTALNRELKICMARRITTCASWGFLLDIGFLDIESFLDIGSFGHWILRKKYLNR